MLPLEALGEELACEEPKLVVVKVLMRGLRLTEGDESFRTALDQLEERLIAHNLL